MRSDGIYKMGMVIALCIAMSDAAAQNTASQVKPATTSVKSAVPSLPHNIFFQLIDSTDRLVLNHSTQFQHVDLSQKYFNSFMSYIKDSTATEVPGLAPKIYYNWTLKNGKIINGDVYWNDAYGYIVFDIDGKRYINYFTAPGVQQLKSIFKLQ